MNGAISLSPSEPSDVDVTDRDIPLVLSNLPATRYEQRIVLVVIVLLVAGFCVAAPFSSVPLIRLDTFIPTYETTLLISGLMTSALLFSQYSVVRSRALLVLACGYLFTALMVIPHLLTFPSVDSPTGLIGGLNSASWVYAFWHAGLPVAAIAYVVLKRSGMTAKDASGSTRTAIFFGIACVIFLVFFVTLIATSGESLLPPILLNSGLWADTWWYTAEVLWLLAFTALVVAWMFRKSVLDLLLCVVLCAWVIEVSLNYFLSFTRYTVGWYSGRFYGLVAATFVLIALIAETTTLSARFARSITMQRREREARLWSMEALTAAIAHEVAQPLAGVIGNGSAGLRWLNREIPKLDEVRNCLEKVVRDGDRANQVLKSIRAMHKKEAGEKVPLNINALLRQSLGLLHRELQNSDVSVETNLNPKLPLIVGNQIQLQQVFLNLVTNAIDAMSGVTDRPHTLQLKSEMYENDGIMVSMQDSGSGIDPDKVDRIFQPSYTTKSQGMGMGLAICQSIIEAHSGRIWVKPGSLHGTLFQFVLPVSV